jgi:hypothetical protein
MKAQYNPNMHTIKIEGFSSRRRIVSSIYIHISRMHIKYRDSLNGRLQHIIFLRRKALLYFFLLVSFKSKYMGRIKKING